MHTIFIYMADVTAMWFELNKPCVLFVFSYCIEMYVKMCTLCMNIYIYICHE